MTSVSRYPLRVIYSHICFTTCDKGILSVNVSLAASRALICRIPLLALSLASVCLGFTRMGDCADEPWIPVGVAVHGLLMLVDAALAAAALLAVASAGSAAVKRALFALTACNWVVFLAW